MGARQPSLAQSGRAGWMMVVAATAARLATPDLSGPDCMLVSSPTPLLVEQLKQDLLSAADNNDENLGLSVCNKLEKLNLSKEHLESTRIGGIVNDVRKRVAESLPKLSNKCRALIKQWRKQTEIYPRSASSVGGGSNGVTPSMISPAMRRLVTPQTPQQRLSDGLSRSSQVSSPRVPSRNVTPSNGVNMVAQAVEKVQNQNSEALRLNLKRKPDGKDDATTMKRSKSALISQPSMVSPQLLSVSEFRKDAASTSELLAQLTENMPQKLSAEVLEAAANAAKSGPHSPVVSVLRQVKTQPSLEEKPEKRKYTKRHAKFFKDGQVPPLAATPSPPATLVTSASVSNLATTTESAPVVAPEAKTKREKAEKVEKVPTTSSVSSDKKVDWYASLPSIEELKKRAAETAKPSKSFRRPYNSKVGERSMLFMPMVDIGVQDVDEYDYPSDRNPKVVCSYPPAARRWMDCL